MNETSLLSNIINYKPKYYDQSTTTIWSKLPITRRSAVLILLFIGNFGELRVILTKRSRNLRNFSGHVSFPGGKADSLKETEWEISRRESFEEIGLLDNDDDLKKTGLKIEKLNILPSYLARTLLSVRPCVGILKTSNNDFNVLNNQLLKLKLNPGESSSIFSVPLRDFIDQRKLSNNLTLNKRKEYVDKKLFKNIWGGLNWKLLSLNFPISNESNEINWIKDIEDLSDDENLNTRNVWGLTANILNELSKIVYLNNTEDKVGDEDLIYYLWKNGKSFHDLKRNEKEIKLIQNEKNVNFKDFMDLQDYEKITRQYNL